LISNFLLWGTWETGRFAQVTFGLDEPILPRLILVFAMAWLLTNKLINLLDSDWLCFNYILMCQSFTLHGEIDSLCDEQLVY